MSEERQSEKTPSIRLGTYYAGTEPRFKRGGRGGVKGSIAAAVIASLITSSAAGAAVYGLLSDRLDSQQRIIEGLKAPSSSSSLGGNSNTSSTVHTEGVSVTGIVEKASPSVVGIRITVGGSASSAVQPQSKAEGSGIIMSSDGYIATNYHVVAYADPVSSYSAKSLMEVFLPDGRQAKAKFIGGDEQTDLAVIKVDLDNLTPAQDGDSSKLKAGELAVVIGNPLGISFAGSVTQGCISAVSRTVTTETSTITLIQTDAAVNPGNSGGALLNSQGQVVGIVNAKISETDVEGLGFAIPINDAKPILEQLKQNGYIKGRPFIGISGTQVTEAVSKQYGIPQGVYVVSVLGDSAAKAAGIEQGDVIVQLAGKDVASMNDINTIKEGYKPGDKIKIKLVRNGKELTLELTLGERSK